jgi:hypothetical protein
MVVKVEQAALFDQNVLGRPLPLVGEQKDIRYYGTIARSVLNGTETTGMGFWSINPYVGCEFGCTYCYARDTHRWTMERRGGRAAGQTGSNSTPEEITASEQTAPPPRRPAALPAWEAFEKEILVKTGVAEVRPDVLEDPLLGGDVAVASWWHGDREHVDITRGRDESLWRREESLWRYR